MTNEQREIIEKLEKLVLEIHRNADRLDQTLQRLERGVKNAVSAEVRDMEIMGAAVYRKDYKKLLGHEDLDEREEELWKELKATLVKGNES